MDTINTPIRQRERDATGADLWSRLPDRSRAIVTFALCGFACPSSIAIVVGGIGVLVPERREEMSQLGLLAVIAATLANLMSATIAGLMLSFS